MSCARVLRWAGTQMNCTNDQNLLEYVYEVNGDTMQTFQVLNLVCVGCKGPKALSTAPGIVSVLGRGKGSCSSEPSMDEVLGVGTSGLICYNHYYCVYLNAYLQVIPKHIKPHVCMQSNMHCFVLREGSACVPQLELVICLPVDM